MIRKFSAFLVAILLVVSLFPTGTLSAAEYTISDGASINIGDYAAGDVFRVDDNASVTFSGTNTNIRIVCGSNVTLTIRDLSIICNGLITGSPMSFSGTGNTLLLEGVSTIHAGTSSYTGISVGDSAALTINSTADPIGSLSVVGGSYSAGIGGGSNDSGGTISISGGTVDATGGLHGAGIGSGDGGSGGTISISGGTVDATGGYNSAGIGGGYRGSGGTISISGGTVDATGGLHGAGIGSGSNGSGATISISGGTVDATGGYNSAGIGGGYGGSGGTISISGGTVDATGGLHGAGIGSGDGGSGGDTISISGGQVFAEGSDGGQDIGIGEVYFGIGSLSISDSAAVFLRNDSSLEPVTDHTHETISALNGGAVYGITVPAGWTPNFGAYLHFNTLTFSANGGTGSVASITDLNGRSVTLPTGNDLTRTNYIFAGWNTAANGSGTSFMAGDSYKLGETMDIFAQWRAVPMLSASSESPIEVGDSVMLTPNITGGTWDFDATALARDGHAFTGLVGGVHTITYTIEGQSVTFDLTVIQAVTPTPTATPTLTPTPIITPANRQDNDGQGVAKTGEVSDTMPQIAAVIGIGVALGCGGLLFVTRKRRARKASK